MSDLKPCPFCGGEACKSKRRFNVSWVYCSSCGASSGYRYDEAEAIAAWNTRAELGSEPPYDELLRCLENGWNISASWDGLRKFWNIELTDEGVRLRDSARADTEYDWTVPATDENMAKYGWVRERTCRFIDDSDGEFPPKCSVCGYEPSIYECSWLGDGGYEFEGNYCPNCGAKVIGG